MVLVILFQTEYDRVVHTVIRPMQLNKVYKYTSSGNIKRIKNQQNHVTSVASHSHIGGIYAFMSGELIWIVFSHTHRE